MIEQQQLKQYLFLALILLMGWLLANQMVYLLDSILGAVLLFILGRRPIKFLISIGISRKWAEWLYFIGIVLSILIPLVIIILILENNYSGLYQLIYKYRSALVILDHKISETIGVQSLMSKEMVASYIQKMGTWLPKIINSTFSILTTIGIMLILLFFLVVGGKSLITNTERFLPFKPENKKILKENIYQSIVSNAILVPFVALVQSLLAWVGYLIGGVPQSHLWVLATFVCSMLPMVGGALIYIPLSLILYLNGNESSGIFILIWGLVVVSSSDNFLRIFLLKQFDNTHPLTTFIGVIIGLNIFGFLGLIYGPLLISAFFILIDIYQKEYGN